MLILPRNTCTYASETSLLQLGNFIQISSKQFCLQQTTVCMVFISPPLQLHKKHKICQHFPHYKQNKHLLCHLQKPWNNHFCSCTSPRNFVTLPWKYETKECLPADHVSIEIIKNYQVVKQVYTFLTGYQSQPKKGSMRTVPKADTRIF